MTSKPNDQFVPLSEQSGLCGGKGQVSCEEANELIQDFLDKMTDTERSNLLQEHLGDCPPCESEFFVYQRIVESLGRCRPDIPSETADRIKRFCDGLCSGENSDDARSGAGVAVDDVSASDLDAASGTGPGLN